MLTSPAPAATPGPANTPMPADVPSASTVGTEDMPTSPEPAATSAPANTPGPADVPSALTKAPSPPSASASTDPSPSTRHKGWYARGPLPHFDAANIYQFITFRLHDSVPAAVIEKWKQKLNWYEDIAAESKEAIELRKRIEKYVDNGRGACYLRDERIARLVQGALRHFDRQRYRLIAWCIMPNHVHVLIQMMDEPLANIIQSWKSYTAHEANKLLNRKGTFWMSDYFDRYIRDEQHFVATVEYILQNPVKAGLVDVAEKWPWSGFIPDNAGNTSVSDAETHLALATLSVGGRNIS